MKLALYLYDGKKQGYEKWKYLNDTTLNIIIPDSTQISEAAKEFFEFLEGYIEGGYYILPKKDVQFIDGYTSEMYIRYKRLK